MEENHSFLYIKPQGSTIERAIINALNFITDFIYEKIIKNHEEIIGGQSTQIANIQHENVETLETLIDMQYENEMLQDEVVDNLEQTLDLEYRVSQLEEKGA